MFRSPIALHQIRCKSILSSAGMAALCDSVSAATACSRCERTFSIDAEKLAGSCSTCYDGKYLCRICVDRHAKDVRLASHTCRPLGEVYEGADFLERNGLVPTPKSCLRHALSFLGVCCSSCAAASAADSMPNDLCGICVKEHSLVHPAHLLATFAPDALSQRTQLITLVTGIVVILGEAAASESAAASLQSLTLAATPAVEAAKTAPFVDSARRRAVAIHAELDSLAGHTEAALAQIDVNRDAVIAAAQVCHSANTKAVHAAAADKQARLETELITADATLCAAVAASETLLEVRLAEDGG